jgi:hypothetical protein
MLAGPVPHGGSALERHARRPLVMVHGWRLHLAQGDRVGVIAGPLDPARAAARRDQDAGAF